MRDVPFLSLTAAYDELRDDIDRALSSVAASGWYLLGEELAAFEGEFAEYVGSVDCVGVANGLDALTLVLRAWGVSAGDEVIVPSNTYIATWLAVSAVGARPVPVEPDAATNVIEASAVEAALTPRTAAVIPVHLYGMPAPVPDIVNLCRQRGIRVLDDAAQAHGARLGGRRVGSLADATAWSFYPSKNLGALGDAGAITTSDDALAAQLRILRNYGSAAKYVNLVRGVNSRLDDLQAAVLRVKLRVLDEWNERRRQLARVYTEKLAGSAARLPIEPAGAHCVWHVYPVRVAERDRIQTLLRARGIETLIHYPIPPHLQQAYADLAIAPGTLPVAEAIHREVLSLPIGPHLAVSDVEYVAAEVLDCLETVSRA